MKDKTHTHTHTRPDAIWTISGELSDLLILKLLIAVINHKMLNHRGDGRRRKWEGWETGEELKQEI